METATKLDRHKQHRRPRLPRPVSRIIELVKTRIPRRFGLDPIRDVQILCPMNRGGVGARSLNIELQAALNPGGEQKVERFGWTFAAGDKVMQIENDYDKEVYNGDIGFIEEVDPDTSRIVVTFDGRRIDYEFADLDTMPPRSTRARARNIRRWSFR
jgi:exodeoxyribonuclease V alpha subunit